MKSNREQVELELVTGCHLHEQQVGNCYSAYRILKVLENTQVWV